MERAAGFVHDDTAQGKLDKLDAILAQTSTSNADATLFVEMLSLPSDGRYPKLDVTPEQRRQRTLGALVSQMEALARKNAVLMIFEDTHWTDPTSLEMFGLIIDRIPRLRVLLIVTFRPGSSRPGSDGLTLRLSPLIAGRTLWAGGTTLVKYRRSGAKPKAIYRALNPPLFTILPSIVRWQRVLARRMSVCAIVPWLDGCLAIPERARGRRQRAQRCTRDRPSRHVDACAVPRIVSPYLCGKYASGNGSSMNSSPWRTKRVALFWKTIGMMLQGSLFADRQSHGCSPNAHLRAHRVSVDGDNMVHAKEFIIFGKCLCGTRPIR